MFNNNTSPNGSTQPGNSVNDSYKRYRRGYNKFDFSRSFYNTERFADINVIDVVEGVEGDKIPFGNKHYIRSYTMNSPIMFDLIKKKTYFMVDNKAILPRNWEKVYKQPNKGDDVEYDVNCFTTSLFPILEQFIANIGYDETNGWSMGVGNNPHGYLTDAEIYTQDFYNAVWRFIFLLESIFSDGSLLSSMNCHLSPTIKVHPYGIPSQNSDVSFDEWLQETLSWFDSSSTERNISVTFPSLSDKGFSTINEHYYVHSPLRTIFDLMRTYSNFRAVLGGSNSSQARVDWLMKQLSRLEFIYGYDPNSVESYGFNLSRLVAYQLVSTQFYTNDSVDNIYNAELFMQNAESTFRKFFSAYNAFPEFTYNGVKTMYDVFSGKCIDIAFQTLYNYFLGVRGNFGTLDYSIFTEVYNYFHMLFFYRKSLRYGDYFVGSKTLPLAPGDVTADVVANGVSAIDMTRSILMQRFLNSVERVSNTWKDYIAGVMDGVTPPNPLEPRFLASSKSKVSGFEVENTAENQGNIVTLLKSGDSNYIYEVEVGEPCIILGVSTYEVAGVYSRTVERFFKHANRFDMFNKFMQNIGDQEITMNERSAAFSPARIFGYTPRHMEYKQRYPIASGGFVSNLPGYAFIRDNKQSGQLDVDFSDSALKITSSFIRNRNSEMDRFYDSLSGLTLASYFHFIVKYENIVTPMRQMEYSPSIL